MYWGNGITHPINIISGAVAEFYCLATSCASLTRTSLCFQHVWRGDFPMHCHIHTKIPPQWKAGILLHFRKHEGVRSLWNCLIFTCLMTGKENKVCGLCNQKAHDWASLGRPHPEVLFCLERPPSCVPVLCLKELWFSRKKKYFQAFLGC